MAFRACMLRATMHGCKNGSKVSETALWGLVVLLDNALRLAFWRVGGTT